MKPITARSSIAVHAPAAFVWDFLRVYDNDPLWRSGLERMAQDPPGPVRDGARVEETLRVLGRTVESLVEVSDVRDGGFTWRVTRGAIAEGSRSVTTTGADSCRVDVVKRVTLTGSDRLLTPLLTIVIRRTELGDLQRAKHLLEQSWKDRP
ncbi:SRPBCC family protein [Nocardiopsis sp. CC223A]|uniref:SRPBCC family protein n=1 Tax=Nocardiopsis sp. CC223A TaxID=3044051 RepID=UPI002795D439|nr:SRPBCC family protein [Nocardiopsis sp. CC223A]